MQDPAAADADSIAEAIATEVVGRISASHPTASSSFRRRLVALYTAQAVGRTPAPGRITAAELAAWLETSPQRINDAYASGLAKLWLQRSKLQD